MIAWQIAVAASMQAVALGIAAALAWLAFGWLGLLGWLASVLWLGGQQMVESWT